MRIGYAWLIAGATFLASQTAVLAQGVPPDAAPVGAAPPSAAAPGIQGSFNPPAPIRPGQAISVLVFPFGFAGGMEPGAAPAAPAEPAAPTGEPGAAGAEGGAAAGSALQPEQQEVVNYLTAAVKAGFLSTPSFSVASFHPQSALIQRARKDEILRPEHLQDLTSPTGAVDLEKARAIAYRLGMQSVLVGTIDMTTDPASRNVEITLEAQLVDSVTGKPLKTAAVGGAAAGAEGVPLLAIQERAAQEAAQRMLPAMGIQLVLPKKNAAPAAPARSSRASTGKLSADERKAARAAAKAEREAAEKAKDAAKAAEKQRKKEEEAARKAAKAGVKPSAEPAAPAAAAPAPSAPAAPAAPAPAPAAPAPAAAGAEPVAAAAPAAGTVQGVADENGQPVPYGYAVGKQDSALPRRERSGLRVPPWLGLVGFLTGVSFLL